MVKNMNNVEQSAVKRMMTFNPETDLGDEQKVNDFVTAFRQLLMSKDEEVETAVKSIFSSLDTLNSDDSEISDNSSETSDMSNQNESSILNNKILVTKINDWLYI